VVVTRSRLQSTARWLGQNYQVLSAWATSGRGTQDSLMKWGYMGGLPTHNYSQPVFEERQLLSGERNYEMFFKERDTCQACPINCKQVFVNESQDARQRLDPVYGGAEYEAMAALGSSCGITDNLAVLKANELCNKYGLDSISTGASIAFVMECFERGFLTGADTGGLEFRWGEAEMLLRAVELIARRDGFGDVMAEGVRRMSEKFGAQTEPLNLTVKGQELPMHELRLKHALGLGYAVSPIGADHNINVHDTDYMSEGSSLERVNTVLKTRSGPLSNTGIDEDKMQIFYNEVNWRNFEDCGVICHFFPYTYQHLAEALSSASGVEYSVPEVLAVGERAQTLSRLFNLREGFGAADDRIPRRVMQAFQTGPLAGVEIKTETFDWARRRFYELMGWEPDTGIPSRESISRLGLDGLLEGIM
jgi:aldehyde:ferredoxin oxidoreductase